MSRRGKVRAQAQALGASAPSGSGIVPEHSLGVTLFALVAGQICLHSCMAGLRMASPLQALRDGQGAGAVGVLLGMFAAAAVLLALPAGKMADRYGSRPPALASLLMSFAGGALATVSQNYVSLCVAGLLAGAGANVGLISMQRSAGGMAKTPGELRRVFGWLGVAPAVANFIGPLCAGLMIDHAGFRAAFATMAILPLFALFALRYLPRETPVVPAASEAGADLSASPSTWALLASPQMRLVLLVNWLMSASWDVHGFVLPILGYQRGLSASAIGTVLGLFAAAVGVVRIVLPLITENVSESRLLMTAMLCAGVVFCLYPFTGSVWTMAVCAVLLGLALGSAQPVIMSTLHQITPEGRHGESIALRSLTLNLSSTAMPLLFGMVGAALGAGSLFWAMGVTIVVGSVTARRVDPGKKIAGAAG